MKTNWEAADMEMVVRRAAVRKRIIESEGGRRAGSRTRPNGASKLAGLRSKRSAVSWRERFLEMPAAHRDVTVVAADFNLGALLDAAAIRTDAEVHRGLAAAVADGFQLDEIIRQRE